MLEGSFRPPSSTAVAQHFPPLKTPYTGDHSPNMTNVRRARDSAHMSGSPSFSSVDGRPSSAQSPDYDSEDRQPRYYHPHHPAAPSHPSSNSSAHLQAQLNQSAPFRQQPLEPLPVPPPPSIKKPDSKSSIENPSKDPSYGPVRAKKKPAGSACNSCHRLKTRCSGGYPCDRCAAHKVPCQFDRDLIYRSPLASNSQQASARNAQVLSSGEPVPLPKPRSRGAQNTNAKAATASAAAAAAKRAIAPIAGLNSTPPNVSSTPPVVPTSTSPQSGPSGPSLPPPPVPSADVGHLPSAAPPQARLPPPHPSVATAPHPSLSNSTRKHKVTPVSTPAPSEAFMSYELNLAPQHGLHSRLSALETSVSGLIQALGAQKASVAPTVTLPPASPPPAISPPNLVLSGSPASFGPERDRTGDPNRMGCPSHANGIGDPLFEGILSTGQAQYLFDIFVECCLPSVPILYRVQLPLLRGRSAFLFTTMLAIGARFCSSQSVAHLPTTNGVSQNGGPPSPIGMNATMGSMAIDEPTYARLVALAYRHLSGTLLKAGHSLDDVRAILFLACWALVSNEEPSGPPNRWVLVGHAARIGRSIGLDRCVTDFPGPHGAWVNGEAYATKREQLDAIKTDHMVRAVETILSSNLRLEPSRSPMSNLTMPSARGSMPSPVKLATGSPFQYDIVSTAQVEALSELAQLWADAHLFLTAAEDRNRTIPGDQLIELGERHNHALDGWSRKWTWHGSSWAPLLGPTLRTVRLLSESLRISLNLALTNVVYAMATVGGFSSGRLHEISSSALERVNGSSTAVIQAHRDSAREGFSLAFAPDIITDGLVSAAITVLQLASPLGLGHPTSRHTAQDSSRIGLNTSRPSSIIGVQTDDERPLTPASTDDKADVEMSDAATGTNVSSTTTTTNQAGQGPRTAGYPSSTACSSPGQTPRPPAEFSPQERFAPAGFMNLARTNGTGEGIGKKPLMEPAVAAHYIRMATDVLQASDRSQTRLGTTMANQIIRLATQSGLMGSTSHAHNGTNESAYSTSTAASHNHRNTRNVTAPRVGEPQLTSSATSHQVNVIDGLPRDRKQAEEEEEEEVEEEYEPERPKAHVSQPAQEHTTKAPDEEDEEEDDDEEDEEDEAAEDGDEEEEEEEEDETDEVGGESQQGREDGLDSGAANNVSMEED